MMRPLQQPQADVDVVWSFMRLQFPRSSEWTMSIVPWGGDMAVVVTTDGVYLAEPDPITGYRLTKVIAR